MIDGVYFGLSDESYHKEPRLSASGIKNLLVSPMDFWVRSWLNPQPKDEDDQPEWALKGRGYHKRICEGKDAFYSAYAPELDPKDFPDALIKADQLKAACAALNLPVSGTKEVLSGRLREWGNQNIWDDIVANHATANKGKVIIPADWIYDIELGAACIEKHPTLSKCFQGGFPEVSIFWTADVESNDGSGEVFQIPMKMRADYLKIAAIIDLKSFANQMKKPIDRAVYYDIAARKYHIQAAVYYEGTERAQELIHQNKVTVVSGPTPPADWLAKVGAADKTFAFVFQQKGIAPVACGYVMPRHLGLISVARAQVREAQQLFHDCQERFGDLPWIMDREMQEIGDTDVPQFATE